MSDVKAAAERRRKHLESYVAGRPKSPYQCGHDLDEEKRAEDNAILADAYLAAAAPDRLEQLAAWLAKKRVRVELAYDSDYRLWECELFPVYGEFDGGGPTALAALESACSTDAARAVLGELPGEEKVDVRNGGGRMTESASVFAIEMTRLSDGQRFYVRSPTTATWALFWDHADAKKYATGLIGAKVVKVTVEVSDDS